METETKSLLRRYGRRPLLSLTIPSTPVLVTTEYEEARKFPDFRYFAQELWKGKEMKGSA